MKALGQLEGLVFKPAHSRYGSCEHFGVRLLCFHFRAQAGPIDVALNTKCVDDLVYTEPGQRGIQLSNGEGGVLTYPRICIAQDCNLEFPVLLEISH